MEDHEVYLRGVKKISIREDRGFENTIQMLSTNVIISLPKKSDLLGSLVVTKCNEHQTEV